MSNVFTRYQLLCLFVDSALASWDELKMFVRMAMSLGGDDDDDDDDDGGWMGGGGLDLFRRTILWKSMSSTLPSPIASFVTHDIKEARYRGASMHYHRKALSQFRPQQRMPPPHRSGIFIASATSFNVTEGAQSEVVREEAHCGNPRPLSLIASDIAAAGYAEKGCEWTSNTMRTCLCGIPSSRGRLVVIVLAGSMGPSDWRRARS